MWSEGSEQIKSVSGILAKVTCLLLACSSLEPGRAAPIEAGDILFCKGGLGPLRGKWVGAEILLSLPDANHVRAYWSIDTHFYRCFPVQPKTTALICWYAALALAIGSLSAPNARLGHAFRWCLGDFPCHRFFLFPIRNWGVSNTAVGQKEVPQAPRKSIGQRKNGWKPMVFEGFSFWLFAIHGYGSKPNGDVLLVGVVLWPHGPRSTIDPGRRARWSSWVAFRVFGGLWLDHGQMCEKLRDVSKVKRIIQKVEVLLDSLIL